jgi:hypothetical protein
MSSSPMTQNDIRTIRACSVCITSFLVAEQAFHPYDCKCVAVLCLAVLYAWYLAGDILRDIEKREECKRVRDALRKRQNVVWPWERM